MSLDTLRYIQNNHYLSQGGIEYAECEVDELINVKLSEMAEKQHVSDVSKWIGIIGEKKKPVTPPPFRYVLTCNILIN